jgi:hypothetical protein
MKRLDIRGYVLALSLVGFSGAWAATAHEVAPTLQKDDPDADAALRKQAAMLTAREKQLAIRTRKVNRLIAKRRALAKQPRPVRYVRVYAGGGGGGSSGGGYSGGGGSTSGGSGGGGGGYTPAPVTITPVASSSTS